MRTLTVLLLLAACGRDPAPEATQAPGIAVPCALGGAEVFSAECRVARAVVDGRTVLTLIAPDGGFRRVEVAADGSGIAAADGALPARTRADGAGGIEVAIAGDRYRLPAAS